jgi:hypothetical protein
MYGGKAGTASMSAPFPLSVYTATLKVEAADSSEALATESISTGQNDLKTGSVSLFKLKA